MKSRTYETASIIYREIIKQPSFKDYTVIITGKPGPTGKTTLYTLLVNAGINAIEISEILYGNVVYLLENDNTMAIDEENKIVLVILNRLRNNVE